jgi:predicted RNase H-like HicB family nuclease
MSQAQNTVTINVEYNTEDKEYGPVYVASCDDLRFTTDGKTFEELLHNVRECLALCLRDADSLTAFNVAPNAQVKIVMELPQNHIELHPHFYTD